MSPTRLHVPVDEGLPAVAATELPPGEALAATFAAAPVGVVLVDASGRICASNQAMQAMFGYRESELLHRPIEMLLPNDLREGHRSFRAQYDLEPEARSMGKGRELRALHADRSTFPVDVALSPVTLPDGRGTVAVVVDRSPKIELDSLFEGTFEAAPYGLVIVDQQGMIVRANSQLAHTLGYEPEALTGLPITRVIPERFHDDPATNLERYFAEPSNLPMGAEHDLTVLHADGSEIPVEIGLAMLTSNRSTVSLVALNDVSERNRLARRLRDANIEMEEFTRVASHDLKSPLRGVSDLVEWIAEELGDDASPSIANNLDRVRTRVVRMELLIDQLLAYARLGRTTGSHRLIDMADLVNDALSLVEVPDSFAVEADVAVAPFVGSSTPLQTVIRNLVSNAVKHHDRHDGVITVRARAVGQTCRIEVIDDGPGIPVTAHTQIFRLFQTAATRNAENAGVGLAVCRRLCESQGASIEVDVHEGRGSTFVVEWPLVSRRDAYDD
ncbi:MAG: PAS domain-containing sensor histidine kinase [Acidimicrobiales bacterium]